MKIVDIFKKKFFLANITQTFHWLLKKCSFPYHECNPITSYYDATLLNHLKQEFCHLNLDRCGAVQRTVTVVKPSNKCVQYTIQVILNKWNGGSKI